MASFNPRRHEEPTCTTLYAQPYDVTATGFYFTDTEGYADCVAALRNVHGEPVEEFEIQFVDGRLIDAELARAIELNQCKIAKYFEAVDEWSNSQKEAAIIAFGDGYKSLSDFDPDDDPEDFDIDIYRVDSLRELAEQFVDEGLFGDIPDNIAGYLDYDKIAYELGMDYSTATINGNFVAYRAC